jgi:anti-sigma regulatory factor (Ser/Thr protein kinase)
VTAELSLKVEPRREELERVHAAIEELAEREGWSAGLIFRVNLILEELVINIMDYGDDEGRHRIEVTVTSDPDEVVMDLVDSGKPFDPTHDAPEPDIGASLDERRVGGLGVYLTRTMVEEMRYRREAEHNHLTLVMSREE